MNNRLSRRSFTRALLAAAATQGILVRSIAQAATNKVPSLGCQTSLDNAGAVKKAGGHFIGLSVAGFLDPDSSDEEFEKKLASLQAAPLPVITCNSFIRRPDLHCTGPEANHDDILVYSRIAFERAQRANVTNITFGSSGSRNLPEGFSYETGIQQFIDLLTKLGPLAKEFGLTVSVEQLQSRECNFINRIGEVERVVRGANHPNIRGVADFYHMAAEGDTAEDLAKTADLIQHVEIAELEGRRIPGTTDQDFRPYFKVLKKSGYAGAIGIEGRFELSELESGFSAIATQWKEA